jgi:hypothetical protein
MDKRSLVDVEAQLREMAVEFRYPPIPEISSKVLPRLKPAAPEKPFYQRKLTWALFALVIIVGGLLAVPPVRAQILEFLQVGVVQIFLGEPVEDPAPTQVPDGSLPREALIPSLQVIAGEIDLQAAQEQLPFSIHLPSYPADLGEPDLVFLQDMAGPFLVLVWMDPRQPEQVRLSLHLIGPGSYALGKSMPRTVGMTQVNEQPAVWAEGPYILTMANGGVENYRLIDGHVLIWEEGGLTYRLETDLSMEEAIRIAESLH